ncbi:hypothetical protein ANCCAN_23552 [Ancylostoma caninum]|uniref:Uncharacterized protein n=1 Tax=Ancylostoma caninum TaxID=29170 RepID=A0A368FEV7_ANCCA|nr:hypothetical protein ANCCAN_23552 [Ancylostoma caninum]
MSCSSSSCSSEASLVVVDAAECNVQESEIPEINSKPESLKWERGACHEELAMEDPPWHIALLVKISCVVMFLAGIFADWLRMRGFIKVKVATDDPRHRVCFCVPFRLLFCWSNFHSFICSVNVERWLRYANFRPPLSQMQRNSSQISSWRKSNGEISGEIQ